MGSTAALRDRLRTRPILVAPGVYDALGARLVEEAGFEACYLSGASVSYSLLGKPDIGLVTAAEMAERAARICEAVRIPVLADADTGYGNALNVRRTVQAYEQAGVAAIQLEDQEFPKRCGHLEGKRVIPRAEMMQKVRAACEVRRDPGLLIIARTDARASEGLDAAVARASAYAEAGADVCFVEAPQDARELAAIPPRVPRPALANMVEGGRTPLHSAAELEAMGYAAVIFPGALARLTAHTARAFLAELRSSGSSAAWRDRMLSFDALNQLLGIGEVRELEKRYQVSEEQ